MRVCSLFSGIGCIDLGFIQAGFDIVWANEFDRDAAKTYRHNFGSDNLAGTFDEILPWSHIDYGVSQKFLEKECRKAYEAQTTPHCRKACSGCGANKFEGGSCRA